MKFALFSKRQSKKKDPKKERIKLRLPLAVKIIYAIAAVCLLVYVAFLLSESFADFFNRYVSSAVRAILAHLTNWIPFSLAEFFLLLIPIWIILISRAVLKRYGDTLSETLSAAVCVLSAIALIFSTFTFGFAPAYRGSTLDKKLGIQRTEVSADELYETSMILVEKLKEEVGNVSYGEDGFSIMPYGKAQMNDKLLDAFDTASDKYTFIQKLNSRIKPVMLSKAMSYTHITGVYTFFTGEANINVDFPDYTLPYTAAHELSHQRGIAREDEANFVAYLVCSASEDSYIRYTAYLGLYEYVASALMQADSDLYMRSYSSLPLCVKDELAAYSRFFEPYVDSTASEVSETVNNTFLTIHGTEGTKSYGMVVDLAVAYYKPQIN
ncbi:MAG: DUF3810 domain-containing protein [Ruminococcaceae bacterium]|nr:DUF3810 domain-containing protein [Oscillospiraceae bacterium]